MHRRFLFFLEACFGPQSPVRVFDSVFFFLLYFWCCLGYVQDLPLVLRRQRHNAPAHLTFLVTLVINFGFFSVQLSFQNIPRIRFFSSTYHTLMALTPPPPPLQIPLGNTSPPPLLPVVKRCNRRVWHRFLKRTPHHHPPPII